jgi:hypothetical protein
VARLACRTTLVVLELVTVALLAMTKRPGLGRSSRSSPLTSAAPARVRVRSLRHAFTENERRAIAMGIAEHLLANSRHAASAVLGLR